MLRQKITKARCLSSDARAVSGDILLVTLFLALLPIPPAMAYFDFNMIAYGIQMICAAGAAGYLGFRQWMRRNKTSASAPQDLVSKELDDSHSSKTSEHESENRKTE